MTLRQHHLAVERRFFTPGPYSPEGQRQVHGLVWTPAVREYRTRSHSPLTFQPIGPR